MKHKTWPQALSLAQDICSRFLHLFMYPVTLCVSRHRCGLLTNQLPLTDDSAVSSINNKYHTGVTIYIRAVNIQRDGEQYGTYYQAVRSYREQGKVKQEVIHLGQHCTPQAAVEAWKREIGELETTRPKQARKLQAKLERLRELTHTD
jgi:hypothetical protein